MTTQRTIDRAREFFATGQLIEAGRLCRDILEIQPGNAAALHLLGIISYYSGDASGAEDLLRRALAADATNPVCHNDLGLLLAAIGKPHAALAAHREAARLAPAFAAAHANAGNVLRQLGFLQEAADAYLAALAVQPAQAQTHSNLGVVLNALGDHWAAIECHRTALALQPAADIHFNLANALRAADQFAAAAQSYGEAILLQPGDAEAHRNLAGVLMRLGRYDEAELAAREALRLIPDSAEGHCVLGQVLSHRGDREAAARAQERALALRPDFAAAQYNLGNALAGLGCMDEGVRWLLAARESAREDPAVHSNLLYTCLFHPALDPREIRVEAEAWDARHARRFRDGFIPREIGATAGRRLRIGYVSPFFCDHVLGRNLFPVVREHDRAACEIFCYSDCTRPDWLTGQFQKAADGWRLTTGVSDDALAAQIRADGIDILVDLTLHMEGNRLLVFARRPASVQVTFGGYPGTTGLAAMDYRFTDPYLDPLGGNDEFYTEESIRLPRSFWVFDPLGDSVPVLPLPASERGWITFGCTCSAYKVNARVLRLWARVLAAVPGSRLVLLFPPGRGREKVAALFAECGIAPARLDFLELCARPAHLERQRDLDIVLDPFPYNGHTTTLEALWLGLPVVTLVGESALARGSFSILSNLGLPELAAHSEDEYVARAAALAADVPRLAGLRAGLRARLEASPLMDARRFTTDIEKAYGEMWRRVGQAG